MGPPGYAGGGLRPKASHCCLVPTRPPTQAVADGQVYAAFSDGSVTAIDIETGTSRWHHQTESAEALVASDQRGVPHCRLEGWPAPGALERATGNCVWAHTVGTWVASVHYGQTVRERPTPTKCVVTLVVLSALGGSRTPNLLIRRSQEGVYPG